jgi:hypothetical protein
MSVLQKMTNAELLALHHELMNPDENWFDYGGEIAADSLDAVLEEMTMRRILA